MHAGALTPETGFALEVFLLDVQARNLSSRTVHYYRQQVGWFNTFLAQQSCHHLARITPHHIRAYLLYLQQERTWKSASVHTAARAIRAFLNFCAAEGLCAASPMNRVKMPRTTEVLRPAFTEQEVRTLLQATKTRRDRAILLCLLDTGFRASEFLGWDVGDVNLPAGTVRVRQTKNRRERTVYLGLRTRRELVKLYATQTTAPEGPMWRTLDTGDRMQYDGLKTLLRDQVRQIVRIFGTRARREIARRHADVHKERQGLPQRLDVFDFLHVAIESKLVIKSTCFKV